MSKAIVKRKRRPPGWTSWADATGCIITYYMVPCFWHSMSMGSYEPNAPTGLIKPKELSPSVGSVGPIGECFRPWNASSPQAKKEFNKKYKHWGKAIMTVQLARGDNR